VSLENIWCRRGDSNRGPSQHLLFTSLRPSKAMIQNRLTISLTPAVASGIQPLTTLILRMISKTVKRVRRGIRGFWPALVLVDSPWKCALRHLAISRSKGHRRLECCITCSVP
jgi:hypothetical protein